MTIWSRRELAPDLILGETAYRDRRLRFGLMTSDRTRHMLVTGGTGAGKSTLLTNLIIQDIDAGRGVAVLDPHGSLVKDVLPHVPGHRIQDVVLIRPADRGTAVSFNVFRHGRNRITNPNVVASSLVSTFKAQWGRESWGPRLQFLLFNAIIAVAERPDATLLLLHRFITDEVLRDRLAAQVRDPIARLFWQTEWPSWSRSLKAEALAPVTNKLGAFVSVEPIRRMVAQVRSRLDMREVMDKQRILLVDLGVGTIGRDPAHLLGGLLLGALQAAAFARSRSEPPLFVYIDEFQTMANDGLETVLSEARKFGVALTLAHQSLSQLDLRAGDRRLREAVIGNCGSLLLFKLGHDDARDLEPVVTPHFTATDVTALGRGQMIARLYAGGQTLAPLSATTMPPVPTSPRAQDYVANIVQQSRERFGSPAASIDQLVARVLGEPGMM